MEMATQNIFFTSDEHYFHDNIIYYTKRPFKNERNMNTELINIHNKVVGENDIVYHIGDFVCSQPLSEPPSTKEINSILNKLKGRHILILGNHDKANPFKYVECGFLHVHTALELEIENRYMILAHDPATATIAQNIPFLCGHIHNLFKTQKNCINVGVDVWGYSPVSIDLILPMIDLFYKNNKEKK